MRGTAADPRLSSIGIVRSSEGGTAGVSDDWEGGATVGKYAGLIHERYRTKTANTNAKAVRMCEMLLRSLELSCRMVSPDAVESIADPSPHRRKLPVPRLRMFHEAVSWQRSHCGPNPPSCLSSCL